MAKIDPILQQTQGRFRPNRNTMQHAAVLDETIKQNPDIITVFLDIAAAYDTVNRTLEEDIELSEDWIRILWSFKFPLQTWSTTGIIFYHQSCQ
jgi:hypothetical protein